MDEQEFLTSTEAAAILGVNPSRMYALHKTGRYGRRIDGYIVFTRAEVEDYAQDRLKRQKGGRPNFHTRPKKAKWASCAATH
ncbi:helix-turn-helix domain-containing protein [Herpetosiphon gulosus]|uniref:Helix-turn-helix domain-containing protein n=1 Tax=Herpetosiphon gulosus TaxID=1973496 RepID=A0ABP9XAG4_9CHLR